MGGEPTRGATVVGNRDYRIDLARISEDRLQRSSQTFASPDGNNPRPLALRR